MYRNSRSAEACVKVSYQTALCKVWQCGPRDACRATGKEHAYPVHLPHRLVRRHRCRALLVRVEKLLGDFKRAELIVPSEDFVVLYFEGDVGLCPESCCMSEGGALMYKRELEMR